MGKMYIYKLLVRFNFILMLFLMCLVVGENGFCLKWVLVLDDNY